MKILVTGAAGFIGYHLVERLLADPDCEIVGLDCLNDYYDPGLKYARLQRLGVEKQQIKEHLLCPSTRSRNLAFFKADIAENATINSLFQKERFDIVCNLAAQAGVRYSLTNPQAYCDANLRGFLNIIEGCRHSDVSHLVYASSSSVYGLNKEMPFRTTDQVDRPISLYAATKKANELIAHTYSALFRLPTTGLRFFTVYGPWGRPDMALFIFTKAILEGKPIFIFNQGLMQRDFTYIDDIIDGVELVIRNRRTPGNPVSEDTADIYRLFNIGRGEPVPLMEFIGAIEKELGRSAEKVYRPMQQGDVEKTWADLSDLHKLYGYIPKVSVNEGIRRFIAWYRSYYISPA